MKLPSLALGVSLFVVSVNCEIQAALIEVGSGADLSYFILESPNIGIREYAIRYDYDPINTPLGASDLLRLIEAEDSAIEFNLLNFGSPAQPNEFLNSITLNGVSEVNDFSPDGISWAQWAAGGQAGAENSAPFAPAPISLDPATWTFGSGLSVNYRLIEPGSTDALVFGSEMPTSSPIPEPSALLLTFGALALGLIRRR